MVRLGSTGQRMRFLRLKMRLLKGKKLGYLQVKVGVTAERVR